MLTKLNLHVQVRSLLFCAHLPNMGGMSDKLKLSIIDAGLGAGVKSKLERPAVGAFSIQLVCSLRILAHVAC